MSEPILSVRDLSVSFPSEYGTVHAVQDLSYEVHKGEALAIVGESGSGKSVSSLAVMGLLPRTATISGEIEMLGHKMFELGDKQLSRLRGNTISMVFQDPLGSLDPRQTVEQLLLEGMRAHGLTKDAQAARTRLTELLSAVGLPKNALSKYPHEFSGGQRQRVGIARALSVDPQLIVADEPVSALDVSIQSQVLNLLEDLQEQFGLTYLFIAHDLSVVRHISDRVGVMYLGRLVELADRDELYDHPLHPYTQALLSAVPVPDPDAKRERIILQGDVPSPADPPKGCAFHPRCPHVMDICREVRPRFRDQGSGHFVACHLTDK